MADEKNDKSLAEQEELPAWPEVKPKQAAFLTAFVFHAGQVGKAANAAKIHRSTHYEWIRTDEHYRKLHASALIQVTSVLEDEAIRRAVEGVSKGVYFQGEQCGEETHYSDGLLMFLLRGAAPEKYRERSEVTGRVDVNLKFQGTMEELLATYRRIADQESEIPSDDPREGTLREQPLLPRN
jgi:hypothetical protein